ncbi:MAG: phage tail assembly chaperone [Allosphingosinicella sp.]
MRAPAVTIETIRRRWPLRPRRRERWALRFDFAALASLERRFAQPIDAIARAAIEEAPGEPLGLFPALVVAALEAGRPDATEADAARLLRHVGRPRLTDLLRSAILEAVHGPDGEPETDEPPAVIDVDRFLSSWCSAGYRPADFWRATPREFAAALSGRRKASVQAHNRLMTAAYWAGCLPRAAEVPPLKDFLIDEEAEPKRDLTPEEQALAWDSWVRATGGQFLDEAAPAEAKPKRARRSRRKKAG